MLKKTKLVGDTKPLGLLPPPSACHPSTTGCYPQWCVAPPPQCTSAAKYLTFGGLCFWGEILFSIPGHLLRPPNLDLLLKTCITLKHFGGQLFQPRPGRQSARASLSLISLHDQRLVVMQPCNVKTGAQAECKISPKVCVRQKNHPILSNSKGSKVFAGCFHQKSWKTTGINMPEVQNGFFWDKPVLLLTKLPPHLVAMCIPDYWVIRWWTENWHKNLQIRRQLQSLISHRGKLQATGFWVDIISKWSDHVMYGCCSLKFLKLTLLCHRLARRACYSWEFAGCIFLAMPLVVGCFPDLSCKSSC